MKTAAGFNWVIARESISKNPQPMKSKVLISICFLASTVFGYGQRPSLELTFSAIYNTDNIELDSIRVMNLTRGGDTVLYRPDSVFSLFYMGIRDHGSRQDEFRVFQNHPNPVTDRTTITLYVPDKGLVSINVSDIMGRPILRTDLRLDRGYHSFRFIPGNGSLFLFTARWGRNTGSIKIIRAGSDERQASSLDLESSVISTLQPKAEAAIQGFPFSPGDSLLYIGYSGNMESGLMDVPDTVETYLFQFTSGVPCPGIPTVIYEGQVYNTVQIFSQCWLKENLNVGTMIPGTQAMSDNGLIEKYCFGDDPDSCDKYQGLYQWDEMMQYTLERGTRGICPAGWHIPTDLEWKILEGAVDSHYGIGNTEWDKWDYRGYDAGTNLKSAAGWLEGGNGSNLFGFAGLPGGYLYAPGSYSGNGYYGIWWISEGTAGIARDHQLDFSSPEVVRYWFDSASGFSVRCVRNNE